MNDVQDGTERYFSLEFKCYRQKRICISIYLFTASFVCKIKDKNIINSKYCVPHTHISTKNDDEQHFK